MKSSEEILKITSKMLVSDFMKTQVISFNMTQTIEECMKILITKQISGAPVVDPAHKVISVVSEFDLMKFVAMKGYRETLGHFQSQLVRESGIIYAGKTDQFSVIMKKFLTNPIRRVVVVDGTGHLLGIVSRRDIMRAFIIAAGEEATILGTTNNQGAKKTA